MTDLDARTAVAQLYAAGETAMTGLHGANRLASNSLLEAAVMGRRAAAAAREDAAAAGERRPPDFPRWDPGRAMRSEERVLITQSWDEIRRLMWNYVGIVRSDPRLARAMRRLAANQAGGLRLLLGPSDRFRPDRAAQPGRGRRAGGALGDGAQGVARPALQYRLSRARRRALAARHRHREDRASCCVVDEPVAASL